MLRSFSRFDDFEQALRGVDGRYLLKSHSGRAWHLRTQQFGDVATLTACNGAAAVFEGALPDAYALLVGITATGSCKVNGDRLLGQHVVWAPPGHELRAPADCGVRWMSVIVPGGEVRRWIEGRACPGRWFMRYRAGRADAAAVRHLVALVATPAVAKGAVAMPRHEIAMRAELLDAVLSVLQSLQPLDLVEARGRPRIDAPKILEQVARLVDERMDQPIHVADICAQTGISATSLQKIVHSLLGMSFHQYLTLRRLHAIHGALREADPSESVTSICSRYGVWDFGRLAGKYRSLFGALPSQQLRR